MSIDTQWVQPLREFLPGFIASQPLLAKSETVLLHGSTTMGIDDPYADLDVWVLLSDNEVARINASSPTRFFEFVVPSLGNRKGHVQVESLDEFHRRVDRCDFHLISELRTARIISDPHGMASSLLARARQPMREDVRRAWFCYHYVEMRGDHRACDNPIERRDAAAILLALAPTLAHALRAACVLDGQPYRYSKWLAHAARNTPTGAQVASMVETVIDQLATGVLRQGGPEATHPITPTLKQIRRTLIEAANRAEIDEPWLREWWLYIDKARAGIQTVAW